MNRIAVAQRLVKLARELMAIEFPTQEAFDKYMKEHPEGDRNNHSVVKTKGQNAPSDGLKMPGQDRVGKPIHEKAWKAHVDLATAQQAWAKKAVADENWMSKASDMSKDMAREYAETPVQELAEKGYEYAKMRHDMGKSSQTPGAYGADIRKWQQTTETGIHPDLGVFNR